MESVARVKIVDNQGRMFALHPGDVLYFDVANGSFYFKRPGEYDPKEEICFQTGEGKRVQFYVRGGQLNAPQAHSVAVLIAALHGLGVREVTDYDHLPIIPAFQFVE